MAQNGCLDGHPRWVADQTAILSHTFLCVTQGNQSMRNSSMLCGCFLEHKSVHVEESQPNGITHREWRENFQLTTYWRHRLGLSSEFLWSMYTARKERGRVCVCGGGGRGGGEGRGETSLALILIFTVHYALVCVLLEKCLAFFSQKMQKKVEQPHSFLLSRLILTWQTSTAWAEYIFREEVSKHPATVQAVGTPLAPNPQRYAASILILEGNPLALQYPEQLRDYLHHHGCSWQASKEIKTVYYACLLWRLVPTVLESPELELLVESEQCSPSCKRQSGEFGCFVGKYPCSQVFRRHQDHPHTHHHDHCLEREDGREYKGSIEGWVSCQKSFRIFYQHAELWA